MAQGFSPLEFPELIFGLAGPIGVDADSLTLTLQKALKEVGYATQLIRVTEEVDRWASGVEHPQEPDFYSVTTFKMDHANALCRKFTDPAALVRIVLRSIKERRRSLIRSKQRKRPLAEAEDAADASSFENERAVPKTAYGQHLRDTFHLADFFVDGINLGKMEDGVTRFVRALFGKNDVSPTRSEYGMYAAKAASLRSLDLSRQVGAAIFSPQGELVTQGCNEVPRAFGGTYWDQEIPDYRDIKLGIDPNDQLRKDMLRDLLERLDDGGFLSKEAQAIGPSQQLVDSLIYVPSAEEMEINPSRTGLKLGCLREAAVMEVTEFGRVVHAEMAAICDAARLGKAVKDSTLYCTTFPCHNCTKHIISCGIARVIFMEPYPKSKAKILHEHEINIEEEAEDRVSFMPFLGISPVKYRDIFQKQRSRKSRGKARDWYFEVPRPMLDVSGPAYLDNEQFEHEMLGADIVISRERRATRGKAEAPTLAEDSGDTK